jgi:hypothetical protein
MYMKIFAAVFFRNSMCLKHLAASFVRTPGDSVGLGVAGFLAFADIVRGAAEGGFAHIYMEFVVFDPKWSCVFVNCSAHLAIRA